MTNPKSDKVKLLFDLFNRTMFHHVMWFSEVKRQLGDEQAYEIFNEVYDKTLKNQMGRICKTLDIKQIDGLPAPLLDLEDEKLDELIKASSINWLANDGIWFQGVEFKSHMFDAKRCNDSCWAQFSPFEAESIKKLLKLPKSPGLDGLKKAFQFRLYAFINEQSFVEETDNSFIFQMNKCRVQTARQRKSLDDYPCKSAGVVEYATFASTIDKRIKTECIGCPPDEHPKEWFCAWKFTIDSIKE